MKKLFDRLDKRYVKICSYASAAVIITVAVVCIMLYSGDVWKTIWSMFMAVLKPIVLGGLLAFLFHPLVVRIEKLLSSEKKPWTRAVAVLLFYLVVAVILSIIVVVAVITVKGGIENLSYDVIRAYLLSLYDQYRDLILEVEEYFSSSSLPIKGIGGLITAAASGIAGFFSALLFGVIFSIYFMIDEEGLRRYWGRAARLIFGEESFRKMAVLAGEANVVFSGYIRGQSIDAAIMGIMTAVALSIAGVPYSVAIGVLTGIGNLIPYVGPVVGFGSILISCLVTGEISKLIPGAIILIVILFVDGNIINPRLLANNVEVHPLLVVASLLAGGAIGGLVGMIVAVPTAAFLKLQFDKYLAKKERLRREEGPGETEEKQSDK